MTKKMFTILVILIAVICGSVLIRFFFFFPATWTFQNDLIQGFFIGFGLAIVIAQIYARIKTTKVNGWVTIFGLGEPSNGMFFRAACAQIFPGPVHVPEEAMYWTTAVDGSGHTLNGKHNYIMHFPAGGLPPNDAFWSLTMGDAKNSFVASPINRYSMSSHSEFVPNVDGSVDIFLQNVSPTGHELNWLPAPTGNFILWLRAYLPGAAILAGKYIVPAVVERN